MSQAISATHSSIIKSASLFMEVHTFRLNEQIIHDGSKKCVELNSHYEILLSLTRSHL